MFFQALIYLGILIVTAVILWKWVIIPILKDQNIIEEDPIETSYTIERDKLKALLEEKAISANSAVECAELRKRIKELDKKIAEAEGVE